MSRAEQVGLQQTRKSVQICWWALMAVVEHSALAQPLCKGVTYNRTQRLSGN